MSDITYNPLISVIVPIYNAELYLNKCIESIISQTYKNIEIILINDGSTDSSLNICKKYASIDNRIIVYDKHNEGLPITRRFGIEHSKGEYILFVDSDDYILDILCERCLKYFFTYDVDFIFFNYYLLKNNSLIKSGVNTKLLILDKEQSFKHLCEHEKSDYIWSKMYKKQCFKNIYFTKYNLYEDAAIYCQIINNSNKILYVNDYLYVYVLHNNNMTKKGKFIDYYFGNTNLIYKFDFLMNFSREIGISFLWQYANLCILAALRLDFKSYRFFYRISKAYLSFFKIRSKNLEQLLFYNFNLISFVPFKVAYILRRYIKKK